MSEKSIYLFCTEGGSDKEYHAHLRAQSGGWIVQYANGPRGRVGQSKNKFEVPATLDAATKVYEDLVKSKMKGGYTEAESGVRFTNTEHAARASGHAQQLPTSISEQQAQALDRDSDWGAQEKANGERRTVEVVGSEVRGINKLGLYVNIPETWVTEFPAFGDVTFDGEHVGDTLYVFDLLVNDGRDIKNSPFAQRYAKLEQLLDGMSNAVPSIKILKAAFTTEEKRALVEATRSGNREGVVYKNLWSTYEAGRTESALKYKFLESSTCIVIAQNQQRSVQIGLRNVAGEVVPTGNVTIPGNQVIPAPGALVEVEYLYYNPGGAFEQPTYLGQRNDILPEEAVLTQITRLKPGVTMDEDGARQFERERG